MSQNNFQCYNCGELNEPNSLFCRSCKFVQPPMQGDHFTRLGVDKTYSVDKSALESKYFALQRLLHPDLFIQKSEIEKNFAFKHTLLLNEAYNIIKSPLKRSEYLLKLNNIKVNSDDADAVKPEMELLDEIFELQTKISDNEDNSNIIWQEIREQKNQICEELDNLFDKKEYLKAAHNTIRLHFLEKLNQHH